MQMKFSLLKCLKLLIEHFWPAPLECENEKWALLEAVGRKISASGLAQGQVQRCGAHSLTPAALSLSAFGAALQNLLCPIQRTHCQRANCTLWQKKNTLRADIPALPSE